MLNMSNSFKRKIIIINILGLLAAVIVIGAIWYRTVGNLLQKNSNENTYHILQQMGGRINYKTDIAEQLLRQLLLDKDMIGSIDNVEDSAKGSYLFIENYFKPKCTSFFVSLPFTGRLRYYVTNEKINEMYYNEYAIDQDNVAPNPMILDNRFELMHLSRIENEEWYNSLELNANNFVWKEIDNDLEFGNISLIQKIIDPFTLEQIGIIRLIVKKTDIFSSIDSNGIAPNSVVTITDTYDNLLYSDYESLSSWEMLQNNQNKMLNASYYIEDNGWLITSYIEPSYYTNQINRANRMTIVVCILSILILIPLSFYLTGRQFARIQVIIDGIDSFKNGNLDHRIRYDYDDEFQQIAVSFNDMASETQSLIGKIYEANEQNKDMQIKFYQSQMNPHFLYNTLSTISHLTLLGKNKEAYEMIKKLAAFYRLTLSSGDMVVTIEEEIDQVQSYIDILKIKYRDTLNVTFHIPENTKPWYISKFSIQPFIENAMKHAWTNDKLNIKIEAIDTQKHIYIHIADDGIGFNKENLSEEDFNTFSGMGIRNVNDRIKLLFGKSHGVSITSKKGKGSCVTIKIPKVDYY